MHVSIAYIGYSGKTGIHNESTEVQTLSCAAQYIPPTAWRQVNSVCAPSNQLKAL